MLSLVRETLALKTVPLLLMCLVTKVSMAQICEQTKPKDSINHVYGFDSQTGVNITDKSDIVQVLEQQGVDAADYIDQEHSVVREAAPLIDWNNLVNRDTSGNEVMDFIDSAPRLWEVEQQEGYQEFCFFDGCPKGLYPSTRLDK